MSTGLLIGLLGGGAFLLLLCLGGGGIWWFTSKGGKGGGGGGLGGGKAKETVYTLNANDTQQFQVNCDDRQRMIVNIKTKLDDPNAKFEAAVEIQDTNMKWSKLASGAGPDIKLEWTSPGTGALTVKMRNHGPGAATATVSHNGIQQ